MRSTGGVSARSVGTAHRGQRRSVESASWPALLVLLGFGVGVVLLFAMLVTLVMDVGQQVPATQVLESSFTARTDATAPYATRTEMTIKPLRKS